MPVLQVQYIDWELKSGVPPPLIVAIQFCSVSAPIVQNLAQVWRKAMIASRSPFSRSSFANVRLGPSGLSCAIQTRIFRRMSIKPRALVPSSIRLEGSGEGTTSVKSWSFPVPHVQV